MGQGDHLWAEKALGPQILSAAFDAFPFHATAQFPLIHHPALNRF